MISPQYKKVVKKRYVEAHVSIYRENGLRVEGLFRKVWMKPGAKSKQ